MNSLTSYNSKAVTRCRFRTFKHWTIDKYLTINVCAEDSQHTLNKDYNFITLD